MKKIYKKFPKKILNFFSKYFLLFLIIVVLVSYGQLLGMSTWEDDQALFFKLAHINESAGYFGSGPFGTGVYRFSATPFIPIYTLFGFNTTAFFGFLILLYTITTLVVYKTFSLMLGNSGGKIAGFLYAAGYVASESIIRMNNSATTSISIILSSLILFSYWKFHKQNKYLWYILALLLYGFVVLIEYSRIHYFIAVIILFELIFLAFQKGVKSFIYSLIRLVPFIIVFYKNYLIDTDARSGEIRNFLTNIIHGQFYQLYGFLASLAYLTIPDWFTNIIFNLSQPINKFIGNSTLFLAMILMLFATLITFAFLWKKSKLRFLIFIFIPVFFIWIFFSGSIFNTPLLRIDSKQLFLTSLGGVILLLFLLVFIVIGKYRKIYTILLLWLLGNLAAYCAYLPTFAYDTVNRYTAHSFVALVGIIGLFYLCLPKNRLLGKIGVIAIILLGIGNIYNSIIYQNNILHTRSYPAKLFFVQLKKSLPEISKGDILYIDVAPEAQNIYNANISAAMMPDTTAFAWRYGIDRYDFILIKNLDELLKIFSSDKIRIEKIHTFWYSKEGLIDTTKDIRGFLLNNFKPSPLTLDMPQTSNVILNKLSNETGFIQPDLAINLKNPITSDLPSILSLYISAIPIQTNSIFFPLVAHDNSSTSIDKAFFDNPQLRQLAFEYKSAKLNFYNTAQFEVSSQWQDRVSKNIHDQDPTTIWQADRVLWSSNKAFVKIRLALPTEIDRVAWVNGFVNNTPTEYTIETSLDGQNWILVKNANLLRRIGTPEIQLERFTPILASFIRIAFTKTIDGDSPSIAEVWVIPSIFKNLDITKVDKFLDQPFAYTSSKAVFLDTLTQMNSMGKVKTFWQGNQASSWQSSPDSEFNLIYDGLPHEYKIALPAGGTYINKIKLSNFAIPGKVTVESIKISYPSFNELVNNLINKN